MSEIKVGYSAVFYNKDDVVYARYVVREKYQDAEKDIKNEHEKIKMYKVKPFNYAKIEKIYYLH